MQQGAEENIRIKEEEATGRWQRKRNHMEIHASYAFPNIISTFKMGT
jgi:hypothetical protein